MAKNLLNFLPKLTARQKDILLWTVNADNRNIIQEGGQHTLESLNFVSTEQAIADIKRCWPSATAQIYRDSRHEVKPIYDKLLEYANEG